MSETQTSFQSGFVFQYLRSPSLKWRGSHCVHSNYCRDKLTHTYSPTFLSLFPCFSVPIPMYNSQVGRTTRRRMFRRATKIDTLKIWRRDNLTRSWCVDGPSRLWDNCRTQPLCCHRVPVAAHLLLSCLPPWPYDVHTSPLCLQLLSPIAPLPLPLQLFSYWSMDEWQRYVQSIYLDPWVQIFRCGLHATVSPVYSPSLSLDCTAAH